MKKTIALIIFALCLNFQMVNAKEIKKTAKKPTAVLYDVPKVGKTKHSSKPVAKSSEKKVKEKSQVKNIKNNKATVKSVGGQPESRRLLELANQSKKSAKNQAKVNLVKNTPKNNPPLTLKKAVVKAEKREKVKLNSSPINYISFTQTGKTVKFGDGVKKTIQLAKNNSKNSELPPIDSSSQRGNLIKIAKSLIGTPYRYGSMNTKRGFDCSGFVSYVFLQKGIKLPRSSAEQFNKLAKVSKPQAGDLVFFRHGKRIGHVGLYLGNGLMVHSPQSGERVRIESIEKPNWKRRYAGARKAVSTNTNSMIAFK